MTLSMTPLVESRFAMTAVRGERRSEREIIAARIASARHWRRRRARLRLRVAIFGRRKARIEARATADRAVPMRPAAA